MKYTDKQKEEIYSEISETVSNWTDIELSHKNAERIFGENTHFLSEVVSWGAGDTVVREEAISLIALATTGRDWPLNRDKWSEDKLSDFQNSIISKLNKWNGEN